MESVCQAGGRLVLGPIGYILVLYAIIGAACIVAGVVSLAFADAG